MYRKQVRRRRAILAALVIISFVLLTATFGQDSNPISRGVSVVLGPFEEGATRALKPARDLVAWVGDSLEAKSENERLLNELEETRAEAVAGAAARSENVQLRSLLGMREAGIVPEGHEPVPARVIARSPNIWVATVTIDRGSSSGVSEGDPVLGPEGLVGQVVSATSGNSQVRLLIDPASRVSGRIVPGGVQGILQPEVGSDNRLILTFLDDEADLDDGATVVTAGWRSEGRASRFPPNIPIGRVVEVSSIDQESSDRIEVEPFANFSRLDLVQVITGGGGP